ncbi:MAG TPA: hypothetical protein VGO14_05210 [Solirubrobacteraceae bacterium]|jgi:hypothetical protein|nr:hypothetical protein [Solirubrobacteraceae bacterium]
MISGSISAARGGRGASAVARRLSLAGLAVGVVALGAALPGLLSGRADDGDSEAQPVASVPVSVLIDTRHPGRQVHGRFLGLSFEAAALGQVASYGEHGNLVTLLRSLGPGVLRFGGVSADTQVAWSDRVTPRPSWARHVIGPDDLRRLGLLAARSGWKVLLTVGLAHYEPTAAAREVAAARGALGGHLAGVEIGNEPDAYAQHGLRPLPWTYAQYSAEVSRYRRAIARLAHGVRLAGPGVSGSKIFATWGRGEASSQRPALLTGHHYPLGCHQVPPPSIERLLSLETRKLEGKSLDRFMSVSRSRSIRFRMDELGSVSCGGADGISNAFASTLWATGYIVQAMAKGLAGVNFQGNPANCLGYAPVCAATAKRQATGMLGAQPAWYALLLARKLIGARSLPTRLSSRARPNILARSFLSGSGALRVVVVDDDPPGSPPAVLRLRVGPRYPQAAVLALSAPSPASTSGVRLGGRSVAADGSWHEPSQTPLIRRRGGIVSLTVAPSSAVLLTLPSAGGR